MRITPVIEHLRRYCPTFEDRIAGALDFDPARANIKLQVPAAFVILTGDEAQPSNAQNVTVQEVVDEFDVVVVLKTRDERGQEPADQLHALRAELWRALIGWVPDEGYEPIEYVGGELLLMNRDALYYRFTFESEMTVGSYSYTGDAPAETWQEHYIAGLPDIESLGIAVDVIDPVADPNLQKPGPDGRIEFQLNEDYSDE